MYYTRWNKIIHSIFFLHKVDEIFILPLYIMYIERNYKFSTPFKTSKALNEFQNTVESLNF